MTSQKAQVPIAKAVIAIFKCEKCGNDFERTVPIQARNHKTGTVTISAVLYPKVIMCSDCHKQEFKAEQTLCDCGATLDMNGNCPNDQQLAEGL